MARAARSGRASREAKVMKIRRGIRAAQLRVALDKERGRPTPKAVVELSEMKLPDLILLAEKKPLTVKSLTKKQSLTDGHLASS